MDDTGNNPDVKFTLYKTLVTYLETDETNTEIK